MKIEISEEFIERYHIIPSFTGEPPHDESPACWCEPELTYKDEVNGNEIWTHRRIN
jgi:hypothetical protein